ncbi:hypothetical protein [Phenylobacterium sp.]|uniref:hypothetical protein n=1 Tax=Phenylobacterium sp. TaxID=1871053 RepID=UPI002ED7EFD2
MSDPLAITDEEAEGLARLAQAQLRLATRLSERALEEPDVDAACHLARASERVARGYRQSLLLKSRLKRDRDVAQREAAAHPAVRTPQQQARVNQRIREVHAAVERVFEEHAEALADEDVDDMLVFLMDTLEEEGHGDGFLAEPIEAQVARMCETFGLPAPGSATEAAAPPDTS